MSRSPTPNPGPAWGEQLDLLAGAESAPPPPAEALAGADGLLALLAQWTACGWMRPVDLVFARFLREQDPQAEASVLLAAALASHQLGRGHVCLDLAATLADSRFALSLPPEGDGPGAAVRLPADVLGALALRDWKEALRASALVGGGEGGSPLLLEDDRLYLRRYWQYEQDVMRGIEARLARGAELRATLPAAWVAQGLDALFGPPAASPGEAAIDWQRAACALMAASAFGVITGGPGTGKTTTVVRLLALLQSLALRQPPGQGQEEARPLRICLAAPTGKAAARLQGSIAGAVRGLALGRFDDGERIRGSIPAEVTTLHRLLGSRPDSRAFRHDARHPLALDVLVIDEASMIDLEMMAAVLAALPAHARLLLLGDKDQLSSVEAGAVLGSLCARAPGGHYQPATASWLAAVGGGGLPRELLDTGGRPIDQAVVMLRRSYRFDGGSGIGRLAQAVNAGDVGAVRGILAEPPPGLAAIALARDDEADLARLAIDGGPAAPGAGARHGYRHYLDLLRRARPQPGDGQAAHDDWARAVLAAHGEFQLLCALRHGPWGVEGLNARIARILAAAGLIELGGGAGPGSAWFLGRPVLVTRNDYGLGLMNGDVGITLALPQPGQGGGAPAPARVAFASADGSAIRWVLPSRLQAVETVFAMTAHKSQGSEFAHAALVLPDRLSPVMTRELVYTGITRARQWFTLAGSARPGAPARFPVLEAATARHVHRAGGLAAGWSRAAG